MAGRDYETSPANETLGLDRIIRGLASDLDQLRAGQISTQDAIARSMLAKQIFNGVRLYLTGTKLLAQKAVVAAALTSTTEDAQSSHASGAVAEPEGRSA